MTADEAKLWRVLDAIWREAQADGAEVQYDIDRFCDPPRLGAFERDWQGHGPRIWLFRVASRMPTGDTSLRFAPDDRNLSDDVCTLAHEGGHFESWRLSGHTQEWKAYERAAIELNESGADNLNATARALILDEEARAWDLGDARLRRHDLVGWSYFVVRREQGLANYRARLLGTAGGRSDDE